MKRFIIGLVSVAALVLASTAAATLVPGVYDPGATGCPVATYSFGTGVLHLEKNCPTPTNAAAGADITDVTGPFTSASFTLASVSQCHGGSPRFDLLTDTGFFFLGCNNVIPVVHGDGTATYTFNAATLAAGGQQVPTPTGSILAADVLIDVQGIADLTNITLNGQPQVPFPTKADCKNGGWMNFTSPAFKNQGDCVSYVATHGRNA